MNYNRRLVKAHRFSLLLALFTLVVAGRAFAEGRYQWTEDRKRALVWNNDPKPGDAASWSGSHDGENYATGPGTLTWYQIDRGFTTGSNISVARKTTPISSYSGTMSHGKFDGVISTVDHGKAYHANFVDGQRKGSWMTGPAVAKAESAEATKKEQAAEPKKSSTAVAEAAPAPQEKVANQKKTGTTTAETAPDGASNAAEEEKSGDTNQPPSPASGPVSTSGTTGAQPSPPLLAQTSADEPEHSVTPATRKAALAPGAVRAIDRPSSGPVKKSEPARTKAEKSEKPKAKATPSQPEEDQPQEVTEQTPAEGPAEKVEAPKLKAESNVPSSSAPAANQTPVDDSIRTLMGPPSSLRSGSPKPETNPTAPAASPPAATETAQTPPDGPKLTAVEAMDISDIEARTRGYDLGDYELPKAEYNATNDTWSISYAGRQSDKAKKFSVTVQDKSGKAEIKK